MFVPSLLHCIAIIAIIAGLQLISDTARDIIVRSYTKYYPICQLGAHLPRSPLPVPRFRFPFPFPVPCSPFVLFRSWFSVPVLRSPFPVLSFSNIPLKSTHFCHCWLGIALRASFLAANTKHSVVTSGHFTSSFPGSPFFSSSSFLGRRLLSRTFSQVSVFYILFVSLMSDDCLQVPRDLKENELSLCS